MSSCAAAADVAPRRHQHVVPHRYLRVLHAQRSLEVDFGLVAELSSISTRFVFLLVHVSNFPEKPCSPPPCWPASPRGGSGHGDGEDLLANTTTTSPSPQSSRPAFLPRCRLPCPKLTRIFSHMQHAGNRRLIKPSRLGVQRPTTRKKSFKLHPEPHTPNPKQKLKSPT